MVVNKMSACKPTDLERKHGEKGMQQFDEISRPETRHPNEREPIMRSAADRINPRETDAWRARTARMMMWSLVFALGLALAPHAGAQDKPNVIIMTDLHLDDGEPDDKQSLIRFLLEANEFNVLGLIATDHTPRPVHKIREVIDAYAQVYQNLTRHASGYPTPDYLRSVTAAGNGSPTENTDGSRLIIRQVDAAQGPVWLATWGGETTLEAALREVGSTRTPSQVDAFVSKIRLWEAWGQSGSGAWIAREFPRMLHLRDYGNLTVTSVQSNQLGESDYDWQYADDGWYEDNIEGKGPLGALFPKRCYQTATDQGMTLHLLSGRYGLNDPEQPTWGGWGGRFNSRKTKRPGNLFDQVPPWDYYIFTPAHDTHAGYNNRHITMARWRRAAQNDFLARLNWSNASTYSAANHPPVAKVDGSLTRIVTSGAVVNLSAAGSTDPDGNPLMYKWWHYPEPSTYKKPLTISNATSRHASFVAPNVASPQTIHIILDVTDTGTPPLTRYQRVIVTVNPGANPPAQNPTPVIYDAPWAWCGQSLNVVAGYEDRAANPGEFTYTWTQVSGPGPVSFHGNSNGTANGPSCAVNIPRSELAPQTKHVFRVTVSNGTRSVTAPLTIIDARHRQNAVGSPSSPSATAVSSSQINLSWSNNNDNVGYRITRRTGTGGEWTLIAYVDKNVTSYADTGLAAGTTYYYRVQTLGPHLNSFPITRNATTPGGSTPPPSPPPSTGGPAAYTWCANEGGSYTFTALVDVAYGANGKFVYRNGVTGAIVFNNTTFGDPIGGVRKAGYYRATATPTPPPPPSGSGTLGLVDASGTRQQANSLDAIRFVAGSSFSADTMHARFTSTSASSAMRMAIYADSSGKPGAVLGDTAQFTAGPGLRSAALKAPVQITAGNVYWIATWTQSGGSTATNVTFVANDGVGTRYRAEPTYSATNPFPSGSTLSYSASTTSAVFAAAQDGSTQTARTAGAGAIVPLDSPVLAGKPVTFKLSGNPSNPHWKLGDGATADGPSVSHTFQKPGIYRVVMGSGLLDCPGKESDIESLLGLERTGTAEGSNSLNMGGKTASFSSIWDVETNGAEVLAAYSNGKTFLTRHRVGKGTVAYVSAAGPIPYPDNDGVFSWIMDKHSVNPWIQVQSGDQGNHLVYSFRSKPGRLYLHVVNLTSHVNGQRIEPNSSNAIDPVAVIPRLELSLELPAQPQEVTVVPAASAVKHAWSNGILNLSLTNVDYHAAVEIVLDGQYKVQNDEDKK